MLKPKKNEIDATMNGSASYANHFVAVATPAGVRVAFMETAPDSSDTFFRSAVLLSFQDAIELKDLLAQIVAPIEQQLGTISPKAS